jgi:hypothetical protein
MTIRIKCTLPNSFILLMDSEKGIVPESFSNDLVEAGDGCIAIATVSEFDSEVEIQLKAKALIAKNINLLKIHESILQISNKKLSLVNSLNIELATVNTLSNQLNIEIWVNSLKEPESILIGYTDLI